MTSDHIDPAFDPAQHPNHRRSRRSVLGQVAVAGVAAGAALTGISTHLRSSALASPQGVPPMNHANLFPSDRLASAVRSPYRQAATATATRATGPDPLVMPPGDGDVFDFTPVERFVWKATGATTDGAFDTFEAFLQPGVPGAPEHIHDANDETFYVLEGTFRFKIGAEIIAAPAGTFAFVPRGTVHSWVNVDAGVSRLLTQFLPGGMRGLFDATSGVIQAVPLDLAALDAVAARYNTRLVGPPMLP